MLLKPDFPTIATLHYVSDDPALGALKPWNISCKSFTRLLDFLQVENYTTVGFEDMAASRIKGRKSIILTFDDCPKHLWDFAIPELLKRNMKAVFYMPTAYLGGYNEWNVVEGLPKVDLMDSDDIAKLNTLGMEIGSHAHHHIMLGERNTEEVIMQLNESKAILESIIDKPVVSIAYPYGSVPHSAYRLSREAGYQYGLAVFTPWQTKYAIRRWIYDDTDSVESIRRKISGTYTWQRVVSDKWNFYSANIMRKAYHYYSGLKKTLGINTISLFFVENIQYIVE
ncbi:MAG TPA: polysaccharide deacetylase family protein [Flavipsychrobacter sp.]